MSTEGRYGLYSQGSTGWSSMREEFQEEDVWGVVRERREFDPKNIRKPVNLDSSNLFTPRRLPTASKMIPRTNSNVIDQEPKVVQHSAPVNIPDWSKIYGTSSKKDSSKNGSWADDDGGGGGGEYVDGGYNGVMTSHWHSDEDEEDDEDDKMMPPHEWIARKLARSQISSFSVCEGVGRTLKGRDLSRVRNAVLTKTGFLE